MKTMWQGFFAEALPYPFVLKSSQHQEVFIMIDIDAMRTIDPRTVDRSTLVQRSSVRLNPAASREERLRDFLEQIRNPYCYLDGKTVVKISFSKTDTTLEDCIEHYLRGL